MAKRTKRPTPQKYDTAKVSNELVEAFVKQNNLVAMKILFYIARAELTVPPGDIVKISIRTKELIDYCKIDKKTLQRYVRRMVETSISIKDEKATSYMSVIPKARFVDGTDLLEVEVYQEVLKLIWEVKNRFTIIDTKQLMHFKSKHSVRMIQILEMIAGFSPDVAKRKIYGLEELNLMFGTNYKRLKAFEVEVLKEVQEELNANSNLTFKYQINFEKKSAAGRPAAVSVTIDLISNTPQGTLF
jgi:plasmid replication initiation protein